MLETSPIGSAQYNDAKVQKSVYEERLKKLTQTFDDEIQEIERQWKVRYALEEKYGKETAKAQFSGLKGDSYYADIKERFSKVDNKLQSGAKLSDEEIAQWEKLKSILDNLNGAKDPFTNYKENLESNLSTISSSFEKIKTLEKELYTMSDADIDGGKKAYLIEKIEAEKKAQQDQFNQLLEEQRSYEEKSLALQKEYDDMRALAKTDAEKEKVDKAYSKKFTDLFFEQMQGSEEFGKIFIDMNEVATEQLEKFKIILQQKLSEAKTIEEKIKIGEFIKKIEQAISGRNFIPNFSKAIKALGDDSLSAAEKIKIAKEEIQKFQDQLGFAKEIISGVSDIFTSLGGNMDSAFGDILSNLDQTISGLQQFGEGAAKAIEGFASGNILQGVAGTIKAIGGAIKAVSGWLNGDKKKERNIKRQAAQLKQLETAYNNLAFAAERAFGSQKYSGQRDLIKNLEQQKIAIEAMMRTESSKKKADKGKIADYKEQITQINQSITELKEGIISDVLQTEIPDMAAKIGDALLDAFGKGEDGVNAINDAFNDMVKNIMRNQLNKILEAQMKPIYANMLKAAGFNSDGTGSFDGFTEAELKDLREQYLSASKIGQEFIKGYADIFKDLQSPDVQGIKGDIKGVTEKTAGALEAQINALRINQVSGLEVMRNSLLNLVKIEENTRNLIQIRKDISELNAKTKNNLAGVG